MITQRVPFFGGGAVAMEGVRGGGLLYVCTLENRAAVLENLSINILLEQQL